MAKAIIIQTDYEEAFELLKEKFPALPEDGSVFVICSTEYDELGNVRHDFLELIDRAARLGYKYINTIVYPSAGAQLVSFRDNVRYVVWLCKNHSAVAFDKDSIREKHIWKDVEWGKREKNYNPRGKDPGNVWIPTLDDGKAHITGHILLSGDEVIERLIKMSLSGGKYELYSGGQKKCNIELPRPSWQGREGACSGRVIFGSSENMSALEPESVGLVVTSPPYWNLKDYFKKGQIGQEPYDCYLHRMKSVWRECYEKLEPDGSMWININIRVSGGEVILIPRDIVRMCRELGFFYRGIFIWHKSSGIPTGEKNIVDRHEYVLLFSKRQDLALDISQLDAIADYRNPLINGGAFWNINRKAGSVGKKYIHPAIYPNELAARIARVGSAPGAMVLDPFLGSGTSLIAALQSGRSCTGYEYNEGFRELMESRFAAELGGLDKVSFEKA